MTELFQISYPQTDFNKVKVKFFINDKNALNKTKKKN